MYVDTFWFRALRAHSTCARLCVLLRVCVRVRAEVGVCVHVRVCMLVLHVVLLALLSVVMIAARLLLPPYVL